MFPERSRRPRALIRTGLSLAGAGAALATGAVATAALVPAASAMAAAPAPTRITYLKNWWSTGSSVWVAHDDGTSARREFTSRFPWAIAFARISPNGRMVDLYQGSVLANGGSRAMVVPASGGRSRVLARNVAVLIWSPDSRSIAGIVHTTGRDRLVVINVSSGRRRTLAAAPCLETPGFSPDGTHLVYAAGAIPRMGVCHDDLYTVPTAGGRATRLTRDQHSSFPVWGPRWIAFSHWRGADSPVSSSLDLITPSGRRRQQVLASQVGQPHAVGWSRDGRRLLTSVSAVTLDRITGKLRTARLLNPLMAPIALSGDGSTVLGTSVVSTARDGTDVVTLPFRGGRVHTLVQRASGPSWNVG